MIANEPSLDELQAFMAEAITRDRPLREDDAVVFEAALVATGNARLSPADQVEIYREQFWLRHIGSLEEDYPTLRHLLGGEPFEELCRQYLHAHPPRAFSLRDLAADMPAFVARTHPYWEDTLLADCANVEWAFIEAFDAADAAPLDASVLAATDEDAWERACIGFHPSLRLVALAHPAHDFREAVRRGETPARPKAKRTYVAVHRAGEIMRCDAVERTAFALLERLARGIPLGAACESVAAMDASVDLESKIAPWFQAWVAAGWLREIRV